MQASPEARMILGLILSQQNPDINLQGMLDNAKEPTTVAANVADRPQFDK